MNKITNKFSFLKSVSEKIKVAVLSMLGSKRVTEEGKARRAGFRTVRTVRVIC